MRKFQSFETKYYERKKRKKKSDNFSENSEMEMYVDPFKSRKHEEFFDFTLALKEFSELPQDNYELIDDIKSDFFIAKEKEFAERYKRKYTVANMSFSSFVKVYSHVFNFKKLDVSSYDERYWD